MPDSDTGMADASTQESDNAQTGMTPEVSPQTEPAQQETADSQPSDQTTTTEPNAATGKQEPVAGTPNTATANQWDSDENPYRKRFNDTQSHAQRLYNEKQERDRQIADYQAKLQTYEEKARQQAEVSKLKPWNAGHPEHKGFRALSEKAATFQKLLQKADTPEKRALLQETMAGEFSQDELANLNQAEQDRKTLISEFSADPRGFITSHIQDAVRSAISEYDQFQGAKSQVQGLINDPQNSRLIEAYAPDMARMMDSNVPAREKAFEYAKLKAELDAMKQQFLQKAETTAADEARQSINGQNPQRRTRGPAQSSDIGDPIAYLTKKGFPPGHPRHVRELLKLSTQ